MGQDNDITYSTLCIDLDSLLDTRVATLFVNGIVSLNTKDDIYNYYTRTIDAFNGVSHEEFLEMYRKRDKRTLSLSVGTPINKMLKDFCCSTMVLQVSTPWAMRPRICINTYPYVLTDKEVNVIIRGIIAAVADMADVYVIHKSNAELTPTYIKEEFSIFIKYDLLEWLSVIDTEEHPNEVKMPEIGLIAPKLYYKDMTKDQSFASTTNQGIDPFDEYSKLLRPVFNIQFLPVSHFSALISGVNENIHNKQHTT